MTVEELEIIVTAKVEQALKEFKKIMPAIKQATQQMEEGINKIKADGFKEKINQAINTVKQKMATLKKQAENNKVAIKVNTQEASKQVSQLQKEIESIEKQISARQIKLNITNGALDKIRGETNQQVINEMPEAGTRRIRNETYKRLDNNENYNSLIKESDKLNSQIEKYNSLLTSAKSKMSELNTETNKNGASQNKLTGLFSGFKGAMEKIKEPLSQMGSILKGKISGIMQGLTQKASSIGNSFKLGLGHVLKYATALFSLRGIYSILSSSAQSWLSSQNAGAQQLSANINYMKYALGSALAPVIQYVTNLVYELLKAIQSVVYALFRVNIFAKASANSMKSTAGSAKKAKEETKSLAGIHDEINNIGDKGNDSGGSGSGGGSPSFDLSGMDNQLSPLAQKLYDFFKPLKESWDKYGGDLIAQVKETAGQIGYLLSSVWGSFEKIITNGTVYTTLELILAIIGNIAEAFANAWNYNGNGDAIIQNLANALNNLLGAINDVVESEDFQQFLNNISDKFREISEKIASIDWEPFINAISEIGTSLGTIAIDILSGLVDIFKWLVENPIVAEIILGIAVAIGILSAAYSVWAAVTGVLTGLQTALNIALGPLIAIIVAIIAVIALIVVAIMNWDSIIKALKDTWEWIKQKAVEIWDAIANFFKKLWQGICETVKNIWNSIKEFLTNLWNGISNIVKTVFTAIGTFFSNIWNGIKNVVTSVWNGISSTISNMITKIKSTISNVLNSIKSVWDNIWNGIKNTVINIWNGIWSGIRGVINSILGGIESFVNGVIKGINVLLKGVSSVANAVGSLIGLNPINLQLSTMSLPRLAKGGVIDSPTMALVGEYSGARTNPEIVTPESKMEDVFERVMSRHEGSGQPIHITLYENGKKIIDETIEEINGRTKRTGKNTIVTVEG